MSYNVDSAEIISGKLTISASAYHQWKDDEGLPEISPFDGLDASFFTRKCKNGHDSGGKKFCGDCGAEAQEGPATVEITSFHWGGCGSGHAYYDALPRFLAALEGSADLVFVWEGGDSISGVRVENGKVVEHEVVQTLGPPCKKQGFKT